MGIHQQPTQPVLTEKSLPPIRWGRRHCKRSTLSLLGGKAEKSQLGEAATQYHQAQAALPQTSWLSLLVEPQAPTGALHSFP